MNIFRITDVLVTLLLCQKIIAFSYTSKDGVNLNYNFRFMRSCRGEHDRIGILPGIALPECVKECGMRPLCKALNYKRMFNTCHLYTSEENLDDRIKGSCVEVKASDIEIKEKHCDASDQDKTCVPDEKTYKPTVNAQNVALDKPTYMSSLHLNNKMLFGGEKGVDGNTNQKMVGRSCFHTNEEKNPWWRVDLEAIYVIQNVTLFNRIHTCCSWRSSNLSLLFGTSDQNMEEVGFVPGQIDDIHTFQFPTGKEARYVQVQLIGGDKVLHLCEVQVFGIPV